MCLTFWDPMDCQSVKLLSSVQLFATPWTVAQQDPLSIEFSRQEHWVGCYSFLQGIFPTQGSNLGLLHYRWILYHLSHQGSPKQLSSWWKLTSTSGPSCLWLNFHIMMSLLFSTWKMEEKIEVIMLAIYKTKNSQILRSKGNWRFELCRKQYEFSISLPRIQSTF